MVGRRGPLLRHRHAALAVRPRTDRCGPRWRGGYVRAMTDRPIRWGIASTGSIAGSMAEALQTLGGPTGAEVVAVGSRAPDSAEEFAARFGIPRAHGSYDELFADP